MSAPMAYMQIKGIIKRYGAMEVVRGIDIDIAEREFVVVVGPSGCGKSTLLRMIAGLEPITEGDLVIDGQRMNDVRPAERGIAMVFQSYALYPHKTVEQNMGFALKVAKTPKDEAARKIARAAEILQLGPLLKRLPRELSGGQRQRVAIGRAIVRNPKVFLFDEPLSNLDASLRLQMRIELAQLHRELQATMVYVTHDQIEAMTLATRIAVMHGGRLQQFAEPKVIYEQPANMFVAGFMGSPAMNFIPAEVADGRLRLTGDTSLPLPAGTSLPNGRKVVLGLRPEHLSPGSGIRAPVEVVEPTGAETIVILRLGGQEITARFDPDSAPREGDAIDLAVAIDKASLFDPDTEERL